MYRVVLLCAVLCACAASSVNHTYSLEDAEVLFEKFIIDYNRQYVNQHEKQMRFNIFKKTLIEINNLNKGQDGPPAFGINIFSDYTKEETKHLVGLTPVSESDGNLCDVVKTDDDIPDAQAPDAFDWREQGIITPVKLQTNCGACYAFSSTGNIEAQYAKLHGKQISLSEQQIIDCFQGKRSDYGCNNGTISGTLMNIIDAGGIESESDYPYIDAEGTTCNFDISKAAAKVTGCISYNLQSQEKLKQLVYQSGPVSVALDASTIRHYNGEVVTNCGNNLDHGVLLIGYGTDPTQGDYWLLKNSWGAGWGNNGFFRIERGEGKNSCGIMNINIASVTVA